MSSTKDDDALMAQNQIQPIDGEDEFLGEDDSAQESFYVAPQWKLIWWKLIKHKVAVAAGIILLLMYLIVIFCEFLSPHTPAKRYPDYLYTKPTQIRFFHEGKLIG